MVRVGNGLTGNFPCLIPVHSGIVHKYAHQLRNHQCRMGIVNLNHIFLMEVFQRSICVQVVGDDTLNGCRNKEILLFQTQRFTFVMVVVRVKDFGNRFRHSLFLLCAEKITLCKQIHIQRRCGTGIPQPQGVDVFGSVTRNHHITRNGQNRCGVFMHHVQMSIVPELTHIAVEMDFLRLFGFGQKPCRTDVFPVVGKFHLLSLNDFLLENAQFVTDGITRCGNVQCGHGIQITRRKTSQTAVTQSRVGFQFKNVVGTEAQIFQSFLELRQNLQIIGVFHQTAPDKKFKREIMNLLFPVAACLFDRLHPADCHYIPQNHCACLHHFLIAGFFGGFAEIQHQFGGQGFLKLFCGER